MSSKQQLASAITSNGKSKYGVDVLGTSIADLSKRDIYEPLSVKEQVINSATEAACMILRIDDVISASKPKGTSPPRGVGPYGGGRVGEDMSGMDM